MRRALHSSPQTWPSSLVLRGGISLATFPQPIAFGKFWTRRSLGKFSGLALESCPPRWSLRTIITGNMIYLGWMVLATSWTLPGPPSFCMLANQSGECQGMPWTWSKGGRSSGPNQRLLGAFYTDMARPNAYGIFPYVLELPRFISRWNHTEIHLDNATTLRLCCNHKQEDGKDRAWICP